jgi:hypothetical protein
VGRGSLLRLYRGRIGLAPSGRQRGKADVSGAEEPDELDIPLGTVGRNVRSAQNAPVGGNGNHPPAARIVPCTGFLFASQRDGISEVRPLGRSIGDARRFAGAGRAVT